MQLKTKQFLDKWLGNFLLFFSVLLARPLGLLLRRNHSLQPEPNTVIYIKLMGIGSLILAADAVASVRKKYPQAKHVLLTGSSVKKGAEMMDLFDEILVINDRAPGKMFMSAGVAMLKCWGMKNKWVADLEVYSKLTTIFSLFTLSRNRFGFSFRDVQFRDFLNTHNIYFNQFVLVELNYNAMARAMGVTEIQQFEYKNFPPRKITNTHPQKVMINNTCSELSKERLLTTEQMRNLIRHLAEKGYEVILTGLLADRSENNTYMEDLPENLSSKVANLCGELTFHEWMEKIYRECLLVITVDSAPLHLAKKMGVPTLSLWGPSHPQTRIEASALHRFIYLHAACSPCVHMVEELPCKGDNLCMKQISTSRIADEFEKLANAIKVG